MQRRSLPCKIPDYVRGNKAAPMTKEETMLLVQLVAATKIINHKSINAKYNKMKDQAWEKLSIDFNSSISRFPRTPAQLRLKWENLKKAARKRCSSMKSNYNKVCRVCFTSEGKLFSMRASSMYTAYEALTGLMRAGKDNLPPFLCTDCANQLLSSNHFKTRALRAHSVLLDILEKHNCITLDSIRSVREKGEVKTMKPTQKQDKSERGNKKRTVEEEPAEKYSLTSYGDFPTAYIKTEGVDSDTEDKMEEGKDNVAIKEEPIEELNSSVIDQVIVKQEDVNESAGHTASPRRESFSVSVKEEVNYSDDENGDSLLGEENSSSASLPTAVEEVKIEITETTVQERPSRALHREDLNQKTATKSIPKDVNAKKRFKCGVCKYTSVHEALFMRHFLLHSANPPYVCNMCDKGFIFIHELISHSKAHEEKPFQCDTCKKTFSTKPILHRHTRTHTVLKPFSCDVCNNVFSCKRSLSKHMEVHAEVRLLKCPICMQTFNDKLSLKQHRSTHPIDPYACEICHRTFNTKAHVRMHAVTHTKERPFSCHVCKKSFNRSDTLRRHYQLHSDRQLFTCDYCNKSFTAKSCLIKHIRIHTGEKPYKCNICKRAFTRICILQQHIQDVHSDVRVKRYPCGMCKSSFKQKRSLTIHLNTHIKADKIYKAYKKKFLQ